MKSFFEITKGILMFGIVTVLVGYCVGFAANIINKPYVSKECSDCKDWNKNHIMEITLFITGAVVWLISIFPNIL